MVHVHAPNVKEGCQRGLGVETNIMLYMDAGSSIGTHTVTYLRTRIPGT